MRILDKNMMKKLSFPDFDVEKMEFLPQKKMLKIFIDGAWLDIEEGMQLGKGVLFFSDWENLSIRRFDSTIEKWFTVEELRIECLEDLCEVKFSDSTVSLCGFGKKNGQWMEWKIVNTKMHAEFDLNI